MGTGSEYILGTYELGFLGIKTRIFQIEYISKCFQNASLPAGAGHTMLEPAGVGHASAIPE
jgi:hypothetical protein